MEKILVIKIVSAALYPLGLACVFAMLACVAWLFSWSKTRTLCGFISVSILVAASNPLVAQSLMHSLESYYPQRAIDEFEKHDAIMVLGGGLRIPLPPAKTTQLGSGSDRYWYAVQLYKAGKAERIVIAGGNVFPQPGFEGEAFYSVELLRSWGVPENAIVIETASRNTEQNLNNTLNYFKSKGVKSLLLVTSAYHMPRAMWQFQHSTRAFELQGIKVTPAATDIIVREQNVPQLLNWLPSAGALAITTAALHEFYGLWFIRLKASLD